MCKHTEIILQSSAWSKASKFFHTLPMLTCLTTLEPSTRANPTDHGVWKWGGKGHNARAEASVSILDLPWRVYIVRKEGRTLPCTVETTSEPQTSAPCWTVPPKHHPIFCSKPVVLSLVFDNNTSISPVTQGQGCRVTIKSMKWLRILSVLGLKCCSYSFFLPVPIFKPRPPKGVFLVSRGQMRIPKHHVKQVNQALKKYLQIWWHGQHKPPLMSLDKHQAPSTGSCWTPGLGSRTLNFHKFPLFADFCPHLFLHGDQQLNLCKEKGLWLVFEDNQKERVDCFLHHG